MLTDYFWIIYLIDILEKLDRVIFLSLWIGVILLVIFGVIFANSYYEEYKTNTDKYTEKLAKKSVKITFISMLIIGGMHAFIPSPSVIYTYIGLSGVDKLIESEGFQKISDKALKVIQRKLDNELLDDYVDKKKIEKL